MSGNATLLYTALTELLGPVDQQTSDAIIGICDDAIRAVLGPWLSAAVRADDRVLPRIAPWALDLARGLQFQNSNGPGDPPTTGLLTLLASRPLDQHEARRFADTVDLAVVLTLGRVTDQVLGPGASARDPAVNELAAPWLAALKLGYRIGLVLELLRLVQPR